MTGLEYISTFVMNVVDDVKSLNWKKLVPRFRIDRYQEFGGGMGLTWKRPGFGFGAGLGRVDFWVGWPRAGENLCGPGCRHR